MDTMMKLIDERIEAKKTTRPKWKVLLEDHKKEIDRMNKEKFSIREQVDIILKAGIFKSLDQKEYRTILQKHFKKRSSSDKNIVPGSEKKIQVPHRGTTIKNAADILSQDVDLLSISIAKKTQT